MQVQRKVCLIILKLILEFVYGDRGQVQGFHWDNERLVDHVLSADDYPDRSQHWVADERAMHMQGAENVAGAICSLSCFRVEVGRTPFVGEKHPSTAA